MNLASKDFVKLTILHLILGGIILLFIEKGDIILFFNEYRSSALNFFFKYITHLGDGLILIPLFLLTLFRGYYWSIMIALNSMIILLFSQGLKRSIFKEFDRPAAFFKDINLNYIEGVDIHYHFSFPSGHTITAFAVFFFLTYMFDSRKLGLILFIAALLVGLSRVFIFQHFYVDIYFGSILGVLSVLISDFLLKKVIKNNNEERLKARSIIKR